MKLLLFSKVKVELETVSSREVSPLVTKIMAETSDFREKVEFCPFWSQDELRVMVLVEETT
jgi:hypothetical protein